ncbi:HesA/MoeB/ThiF family protein [Methylophaga sp. OBS3]|uniref:HesA/MoeB/ThiF family protein n=1 Tax=Methylophaga sp. OBS3 TaxID=2991934 RepID=UPI0022597F92|nr:molybdopterin-synthase adenylyltransferase MoeB [Methylophaga sp. OBS3]MCX4190734.1 molybdopterin-synthase adenylyltransferase MoeB [Methylophaga sp. OBS3]
MNDQQLLRYSRHILLPHLEYDGQQKLINSRVMIIGMGGLGSPVALYLAASGVGNLVLVDDDEVELTNLQRQIIHRTETVGQLKTDSAATTINALNEEVVVECIAKRLDDDELSTLLPDIDVVVDCTDNFASRFLLNRLCQQTQTSWVSGAAIRWEGQVTVFDPRQGGAPCYRCLYDDEGNETPQSCAENGVLSPLLGLIGSIQAIETIKLLTDAGQSLSGRVLMIDALSLQIREMRLPQDPACPVCHAQGK